MFIWLKGFWYSLRLRSFNAETRRKAVGALKDIGYSLPAKYLAVTPLIKALDDDSCFLQQDAIITLGNLKNGRALESII